MRLRVTVNEAGEVRAAHAATLGLQPEFERAGERAGQVKVERPLRILQSLPRDPGKPMGQRPRFRLQRVRGYHAVGQADAHRGVGVDPVTGEQELLRVQEADVRRPGGGPAIPGHQADENVGIAEKGAWGHQDDVAENGKA